MSEGIGNLELLIAGLVQVFRQYSGKEGDPRTLTKAELKSLLNNELANLLGKQTDKTQVEEIFKSLDADADGTVDFKEYVVFVATIAMVCDEFLK